MEMSSIPVSDSSKKIWESLKDDPEESYENAINRIIGIVYDVEPLTELDLSDMDGSMRDFKDGKYVTNKQLRKDLGLCPAAGYP